VPVSVLSFEVLFAATATALHTIANEPVGTAHGSSRNSSSTSTSTSTSTSAGRSGVSNVSHWVPATLLPAEGNLEPLNPKRTVGVGATAFFNSAAVPISIRYAHGDFPTGILHNLEGIPMGPFVVDVHV
jgi:hypothetical protein